MHTKKIQHFAEAAFWPAALLRRKFGAKRRIAQGGLCPPEHLNTGGWSDQRERNPKRKTRHRRVFLFGADEQIRTVDLFLTKEVLCLLSYISIWSCRSTYLIISDLPLFVNSFFSFFLTISLLVFHILFCCSARKYHFPLIIGKSLPQCYMPIFLCGPRQSLARKIKLGGRPPNKKSRLSFFT